MMQNENPISDFAMKRIAKIFTNSAKPCEAIREAINSTGTFDGKETIQLYLGNAYKVQLLIKC